MITFIKKILVFCFLSAGIIAVIVLLPKKIIEANTSFKINNNASQIVFGHSHSSYAYNDSLIMNFQNLADAGESYFYTYQKVKNIIPNNPNIKTVFIEFANNQITSEMDQWIWGFEKMSYFLPIYAAHIDNDDYNLLYQNNPQDLTACLSVSAKKNIVRIAKRDFSIENSIDGYKWDDRNMINMDLEKTKLDSVDYGVNYKTSSINLDYLRKTIDFCKANNKAVFLIRSPQHKALSVLKNEEHYKRIKNTQFSDVDLLDFNEFVVPNDYYIDLDHLNNKGAELFSKMFNNLLQNNLLKHTNKELIIKDAILIHNRNVTNL